jgi:hypothetical protein
MPGRFGSHKRLGRERRKQLKVAEWAIKELFVTQRYVVKLEAAIVQLDKNFDFAAAISTLAGKEAA